MTAFRHPRLLSAPALAITASLLLAGAAAAADLTATGANGGTWQGTRTCANADTARTCYGSGTYTSPAGRVTARSGTSVLTKGNWTHQGTVTRPSGRTVQTSVIRKW
ncbi:MAG: hypothetical protein ACKVPY_07310 [Paracoccaceae bacterium]